MFQQIEVVSSVIRYLLYDQKQEIFLVVLRNHKAYEYNRVPLEFVENFKAAPSKGKFWAKWLQDCKVKNPNG